MNSRSAFQRSTAADATGRWIRRGRTVVVDLGARTLPPHRRELQEEISEEISSPNQVIDSRIDVHAQYALLRLSKDPRASGDAGALLRAVKRGQLGGIYKEDQQVPAQRARNLNRGWWQLIPQNADAAFVWDPNNRAAPPILVFRSSIRQDPWRLDKALQRAWGLFQAAANLSTAAGSADVARVSLAFWPGAFLGPALPVTALLPTLRKLDPSEVAMAMPVFGTSLDYDRIQVSDALGVGRKPFTLAIPTRVRTTVLNLGPGPFRSPASNKGMLIHELTHSWQSQHHPDPQMFEANSLASQALAKILGESAYCYLPGKRFGSYAAEQIAKSVERGALGFGGAHERAIIDHVKSVPMGKEDTENYRSLLTPRTTKRGAPGVVCFSWKNPS